VHEEALAYRYLPATDAEREHVERFFPPVVIAGEEHALEVDCEKLNYGAWPNPLRWGEVTNIVIKDKTLRGMLLAVSFKGLKSIDTIEIPLKKLSQPEGEVLAVVGRYYARGIAAKQHNAASPVASV
jgi:hypothetical protein